MFMVYLWLFNQANLSWQHPLTHTLRLMAVYHATLHVYAESKVHHINNFITFNTLYIVHYKDIYQFQPCIITILLYQALARIEK